MRNRFIKVTLDDAEYEELVRKSGREPLAAYVRRMVVGCIEIPAVIGEYHEYSGNPEFDISKSVAGEPAIPAPKKKSKLCQHGNDPVTCAYSSCRGAL